jgi:hypothetical protein
MFVFSLLVRALVRLLVLPSAGDGTKDLEILVLRHQLGVLRRKAARPRFTAFDLILLAVASRALPHNRWTSFLVTPQTLLRWHRELVRRKWTYRTTRKPGRPPIDAEVAVLVLRMAREPSLGLRENLRGAPQARYLGECHHDQNFAATKWVRSGSETLRIHLDAVPPRLGRGASRPGRFWPATSSR